MRVAFHDGPVHERAGVALVTVANDVVGLVFCLTTGGPLSTGRETGAAATSQSGLGYLIDDFLGGHAGERFGQRLVAALGDVVAYVVLADLSQMAQSYSVLVRVKIYIGIALDRLVCFRVGIKKVGNHFVFSDRSLNNLFNVFGFDLGIKDSLWFDNHQRTLFTQAVTTGLFEGFDREIFDAFFLE